jgi:hypothetical protein
MLGAPLFVRGCIAGDPKLVRSQARSSLCRYLTSMINAADILPARFARSSEQAIAHATRFDDAQLLDIWVSSACLINEDMRAGRALDWWSQQVADGLARMSRQLSVGQSLWRGSAWADDQDLQRDELAPLCCSLSREIATNFVDDLGSLWPDAEHGVGLTLAGRPARPQLARVQIGRGVRAVPVAAIMDRWSDECGIMHDHQGVHEREVKLLPCSLRAVGRDDGGTLVLLAGR